MTREQWQATVADAERAFPRECCGVLLGRSDPDRRLVQEVLSAQNVADGDRRRRYAVDPRVLLEAHRTARESDSEVVGYYHSHPADPPVPSTEDAAHAWPGVSYLIVGRASHGGWVVRCWRWSPERGFLEETVETVDEAGSELRRS